MERLTTDKPVSEMRMVELAHNSCFAKDRNATYRDYDIEIDARDLIREAARSISCLCVDDCFYTDDETFDKIMLDWCQYGIEDECGRLALIYRNLWAQADLYEGLKTYEVTGLTPDQIIAMDKEYRAKCEEVAQYEKLEEQGRLIELPCKVREMVYVDKKCFDEWYMFLELKKYVIAEVINFKYGKNGLYVSLKPLTERAMSTRYHKFFSLSAFGKKIFKTSEATEKALTAMKQE